MKSKRTQEALSLTLEINIHSINCATYAAKFLHMLLHTRQYIIHLPICQVMRISHIGVQRAIWKTWLLRTWQRPRQGHNGGKSPVLHRRTLNYSLK